MYIVVYIMQKIIKEIDIGGDGTIDVDEFIKAFK